MRQLPRLHLLLGPDKLKTVRTYVASNLGYFESPLDGEDIVIIHR